MTGSYKNSLLGGAGRRQLLGVGSQSSRLVFAFLYKSTFVFLKHTDKWWLSHYTKASLKPGEAGRAQALVAGLQWGKRGRGGDLLSLLFVKSRIRTERHIGI